MVPPNFRPPFIPHKVSCPAHQRPLVLRLNADAYSPARRFVKTTHRAAPMVKLLSESAALAYSPRPALSGCLPFKTYFPCSQPITQVFYHFARTVSRGRATSRSAEKSIGHAGAHRFSYLPTGLPTGLPTDLSIDFSIALSNSFFTSSLMSVFLPKKRAKRRFLTFSSTDLINSSVSRT